MKVRDSRFELLRIFSMFSIILAHFDGKGQLWRFDLNNHFFNGIVASSYLSLGKLGAFLFVMITGYFVGNKQITIKKGLIKGISIWLDTLYYTLLIFVSLLIFNKINITHQTVFMSFFPFLSAHYWFVDAYIILMLLLPFTNKIIIELPKRKFMYFLCLISILGNILCQIGNSSFTVNSSFGYILPSYFVGAYISKFNLKIRHAGYKSIIVYLMIVLCGGISDKFFSSALANFFTDGIFQLILATLIFVCISQNNLFYSKKINAFAQTVFSAYLITENNFIRPMLWHTFGFVSIKNFFLVNLYGIPTVILIMIFAFLIDQVRLCVFKRLKLIKLINNFINSLYNKWLRI